MAETPTTGGRPEQGELDREIHYRGLVYFTIGLAILVLLSAALMWAFSAHLRSQLVAADPPPPALPEAREPHLPPGPQLQTEFTADIEALRRSEEELLDRYSWIDREAGRVRIPIERAIELIAEGERPIDEAPASDPDTPGDAPDEANVSTEDDTEPGASN